MLVSNHLSFYSSNSLVYVPPPAEVVASSMPQAEFNKNHIVLLKEMVTEHDFVWAIADFVTASRNKLGHG
jgi:hypothetical protein